MPPIRSARSLKQRPEVAVEQRRPVRERVRDEGAPAARGADRRGLAGVLGESAKKRRALRGVAIGQYLAVRFEKGADVFLQSVTRQVPTPVASKRRMLDAKRGEESA